MSAPLVQELVFRTKAELAGAKAAEDALQREIGKLKALGDSSKEAEAKLAALQARMKNSTGPAGGGFLGGLKDAASQIPGVGSALQALATPAGAAVAGVSALVGVMAKARSEFAANQESVFKLDAALAQNQLLTDATRERYAALADTLESQTAISGEKWLDVLTRLTQFGADPAQIEQYTEAVKNLAGIMGGDVEGAASAVSKAMQGNFAMFSRYGIVVQEAGTQTEKMATLMEDLARRGGGQLEARAQSLNGHWAQMKLQLGNVLENVGRFINDGEKTGGVVGGLARTFAWWAEVTGGTTKKLDGMANALKKTKIDEEALLATKGRMDAYLGSLATGFNNARTATAGMAGEFEEIATAEDKLAAATTALGLANLEVWFAENPQEELEYLRRKAGLEHNLAAAHYATAAALAAKKIAILNEQEAREQGELDDVSRSIADRAPKIALAKFEAAKHVAPYQAADEMFQQTQRDLAKKREEFEYWKSQGSSYTGNADQAASEVADLEQKLERDHTSRSFFKKGAAGKGSVDGQSIAEAEAAQAADLARKQKLEEAHAAGAAARAPQLRKLERDRDQADALRLLEEQRRAAAAKAADIKLRSDPTKLPFGPQQGPSVPGLPAGVVPPPGFRGEFGVPDTRGGVSAVGNFMGQGVDNTAALIAIVGDLKRQQDLQARQIESLRT